jgi:hypothetical protein
MASTTDNSNLIGRKGEAKAIVEKHLLASQMKSGDVEVRITISEFIYQLVPRVY